VLGKIDFEVYYEITTQAIIIGIWKTFRFYALDVIATDYDEN
jgi:hypothetical protein